MFGYDMRRQFIELLDRMQEVDISEFPNYKVMVRVKNALVEKGFPEQRAERLAALMPISVSASASADDELVNKAADAVANAAYRMLIQVSKDFSGNPHDVLESMVGNLALTMDF